jgi:threonine synthase
MKYYFECSNCGKEFHDEKFMYLCTNCSIDQPENLPPKGVLKVLYDYNTIKEKTKEELISSEWIDILPIQSLKSFPNLRVGKTPLYKFDYQMFDESPFTLYLKDDSQNPTFSFKDRASALVSAYAYENNIDTIVAASTGNAGSSLAGICAANNQKAIIFVPASAPKAKLTQIMMYGAQIVPVDGNYDMAFDLSMEATKKFGWFNRNTAFNPFTIEGKKSIGLELFENFDGKLPNIIFVPVGDGVIISGLYKGFEDLLMLGLIKDIPKVIAVQANGSPNIAKNVFTDEFVAEPSKTLADSISVDIPRNFYMIKDFILKYNGEAVTVTDAQILSASKELSKNYGLFAEPAAAAAFAGFSKYLKFNKIHNESKALVLLTGSGLKDLQSIQSLIELPNPVQPDLNAIEKLLNL